MIEKNKQNLRAIFPELADAFKDFQLSQVYFAKHMYAEEWDENDEATKRKLTGRLRNKIDGSGKMTSDELIKLQNILTKMGESLTKIGKDSIKATAMKRKEKIAMMIEYWDPEESEKKK